MQVEVHIDPSQSNGEQESLVRPVRLLPDGQGAGVVFRKQVYPLHRERGGSNRYYIRLADPTHAKEDCALLGSDRPLDWIAEDEAVGPSSTGAVVSADKLLHWRAEATAFGRYLVFNGGRLELNRALRLIHEAGYSYLRASKPEAGTGVEGNYDWCVRLETDDAPEVIHAALLKATASETAQGETTKSAVERLQRQSAAFSDSVLSLQARIEALEKLLSLVREQSKTLQDSQHERARAGRELQEQLRQERERNAALMRELDAASLAARRVSAASETVDRLRRNYALLQAQFRDAQQELTVLRQSRLVGGAEAPPSNREVAALLEKVQSAEGEIARLQDEQQIVQALLSEAEAERDRSQLVALDSRKSLEELKLEVNEAVDQVRTQMESVSSSMTSLDVLDAEITDLRTQLANIEAMRKAVSAEPPVEDDEAADEEQARVSRTDAALQLLKSLAKLAFPRLRLSETSMEEIVVRRLHTDELWRELHALDSPGDVVRSSNRIGDAGWRELRQHINERTRVYWRPHDGLCYIHVWWKTNNAEQQRLHDALIRNPHYGF